MSNLITLGLKTLLAREFGLSLGLKSLGLGEMKPAPYATAYTIADVAMSVGRP